MKTKILYEVVAHAGFHVAEVEIARSGKWLRLNHWRPYIRSIEWGSPAPELLAEAKALNAEQKALNVRRRALLDKLKATQPELLAAAAKVPETPPTKPESFLILDEDIV